MQFLAFSILKEVFLDYTFPSSNQPISHSFFYRTVSSKWPTPAVFCFFCLCFSPLHSNKAAVASASLPPMTSHSQIRGYVSAHSSSEPTDALNTGERFSYYEALYNEHSPALLSTSHPVFSCSGATGLSPGTFCCFSSSAPPSLFLIW